MYSFAEEVIALAQELTSSAPRCSPLADLCTVHRKWQTVGVVGRVGEAVAVRGKQQQ
jgi:hypothetical protein